MRPLAGDLQLLARIAIELVSVPEKNWKFSLADVEERKFWKDYMRVGRRNSA
jgi:polyphosphate kinase 2 (PPK2 family)